MKVLVVAVGTNDREQITLNYIYEFKNNPPTLGDIKELGNKLSKDSKSDSVVIINWLPLSE